MSWVHSQFQQRPNRKGGSTSSTFIVTMKTFLLCKGAYGVLIKHRTVLCQLENTPGMFASTPFACSPL